MPDIEIRYEFHSTTSEYQNRHMIAMVTTNIRIEVRLGLAGEGIELGSMSRIPPFLLKPWGILICIPQDF